MDFDPESTENRPTERPGANFSNARSLSFHYPYPYNFGIALPGFFVPFPSYTIYPNAAAEQLVPSRFRASFLNGVHEDLTDHETLGVTSSQIQDVQLSTDSDPDFDSAPQAETRALCSKPGQQDWLYEAAVHHNSLNELNLQQAGTVIHTTSDTHLHYPTTEQQNWSNESTARDNMPNGFDLAWQGSTAYTPFMNGFDQDASTNLLRSNHREAVTSDNSSFDSQLSSKSSNAETDSFQASTSTYGTSSLLQESSTNTTIPSPSPETSLSSPASPTPPPTDDLSPNSIRHPCPHCHSTFARQGDLTRHAKIHFPERHRKYDCPEQGCIRKGRKGFTRRDKWRDHVRGVHGLEEDGGAL